MEAVPSSVGITSGYGMTEAPIVSPDRHRRARRVEARRRRHARRRGVEFKVLDNGELVVKGPQVMRGYVDSSLDADAFTDDGWLHTGDMARFDEHGAVLITGRIKDIIVRKGENISAKEVEDVLYAHPKIADVAVLGIPDDERGEMAVAFVVPAGRRPTRRRSADIVEHCKAVGLMTQKIPERLEIIDAMPRNPSGKVPKHELRARIVPNRRPAPELSASPERAGATSASKSRCWAGSRPAVSSGCHCTASSQARVELEAFDDAVGRGGRRRAVRRRAWRPPGGDGTTRRRASCRTPSRAGSRRSTSTGCSHAPPGLARAAVRVRRREGRGCAGAACRRTRR